MGSVNDQSSPEVQVREGRYYRTRRGNVVGPARRDTMHPYADTNPWRVGAYTYTHHGLVSLDGSTDVEDLVAEVPPPEAKAIAYPDLDVGEGYRRLQLGESVQAGDEMTYDWSEPVDHDLWRPVSEHWIGKVIHEDFVPVRRSHLSAHERMMYLLAEHLLNPSAIGLHAWAVRGCDLLAEVQQMDPEKYAKYVSQQDGED